LTFLRKILKTSKCPQKWPRKNAQEGQETAQESQKTAQERARMRKNFLGQTSVKN
jgi:hypothetical protein